MIEPHSTATDAELLARAEHDAHAFRVIYDRHAEAVFGSFRRRGVDHHTALDMTAETFAQAWLSRARFVDRRNGSAAPWLFGIARHVLSHAARHRAVRVSARERLAMATPCDATDRETETVVERIDGIDPALERSWRVLPDASRRAVRARVFDGRSYEEIADDLDCSTVAARIKVSRAMASMRRDLENETMEDEEWRRT